MTCTQQSAQILSVQLSEQILIAGTQMEKQNITPFPEIPTSHWPLCPQGKSLF